MSAIVNASGIRGVVHVGGIPSVKVQGLRFGGCA